MKYILRATTRDRARPGNVCRYEERVDVDESALAEELYEFVCEIEMEQPGAVLVHVEVSTADHCESCAGRT